MTAKDAGLEQLREKVKKGFVLGVIGLGRVGLPLATVFAKKGVKTIGFDIRKDHIQRINRAEAPFVEEHLQEYLTSAISSSSLKATSDSRELGMCDVIFITVATPLTRTLQPDYSQIYSAMNELLNSDISGKLLVLRSTSTPLTMENIVQPYLEMKTGLKAGKDFGLAVCPERIAEGKAIAEIEKLPEIVGGINQISAEIAEAAFKRINPQKRILFLTPRAAALAKLFTNVCRYVNFALANEFALIAETYGEDAYQIIRSANADYVRTSIPIPGLAGGPCLSKDGYYLTHNSTFMDFVLMAWRLNEAVPAVICDRLLKEMEKKSKKAVHLKIGILGLAYKAGSDDLRDSPALRIVDILKSNGAEIYAYDPRVTGEEAKLYGLQTHSLETVVAKSDAFILATNHPEFSTLPAVLEKQGAGKVLLDCWGMFGREDFKNLKYLTFGRGQ